MSRRGSAQTNPILTKEGGEWSAVPSENASQGAYTINDPIVIIKKTNHLYFQ